MFPCSVLSMNLVWCLFIYLIYGRDIISPVQIRDASFAFTIRKRYSKILGPDKKKKSESGLLLIASKHPIWPIDMIPQ